MNEQKLRIMIRGAIVESLGVPAEHVAERLRDYQERADAAYAEDDFKSFAVWLKRVTYDLEGLVSDFERGEEKDNEYFKYYEGWTKEDVQSLIDGMNDIIGI